MKKILFLSLVLYSCSSQWHINRAIKKDGSILNQYNDTIQLNRIVYDTIFGADGDTIAIIQRVEYYDTIIQTKYVKGKTRFEFKFQRDSLLHVLKMERQFTKQNKVDNKFKADSLQHLLKMERQFTKQNKSNKRAEKVNSRQDNRTLRASNKTLLWCLLSLLLGIWVGVFLKMRSDVVYFRELDKRKQ